MPGAAGPAHAPQLLLIRDVLDTNTCADFRRHPGMYATGIDIDLALAHLGAEQHGVVSIEQLLQVGVSRAVASSWARRGRLHRLHRGVYHIGHAAPSLHARWMAAVLAGGDGAVISHRSAAEAWGIAGRFTHDVIDVAVPRASVGRPGIEFHNRAELEPKDVAVVGRIPATSVSRTLVDLSRCLTASQLAHVFYEAAYRDLLDVDAVRSCLMRRGRRWRIRVVRTAISMHLAGSAGTRSFLEDRLLELIELWGLPVPQVNVRIELGSRWREVDAWWPDAKLCIEVDGPGHARPRAQVRDAELDVACRDAGIRLLRLTSHDLYHASRRLRGILVEALAHHACALADCDRVDFIPPLGD